MTCLVLALVQIALVLAGLLLLARDAPLLLLARQPLALELLLSIALLRLLSIDAITDVIRTRVALTELALLCLTPRIGDTRTALGLFPALRIATASLRCAHLFGTGLGLPHLRLVDLHCMHLLGTPGLRFTLVDFRGATLRHLTLRILPLGGALPGRVAHRLTSLLARLLLRLALRGFLVRALCLLAAMRCALGGGLSLLLFLGRVVLMVTGHGRRSESGGQRCADDQ